MHAATVTGHPRPPLLPSDILDDGAVPCLYTDLANPTSNRIYQALGYDAVLDRTLLRFD